MADLGDSFNPNDVPEDDRSFEPVPAGDYLCQVIESDVVKTKDRNGEILKLTIEIIEGPYERRKVFENLNIRNPSPDAQRIAQRALADLCLATGTGAIRNSEELHDKPFVARLKIEPAKDGYDAKNKVARYKPRSGQAPQAIRPAVPDRAPVSVSATTAAPPQQAAPGSKPWTRPAA